jgi:hypothetical protein
MGKKGCGSSQLITTPYFYHLSSIFALLIPIVSGAQGQPMEEANKTLCYSNQPAETALPSQKWLENPYLHQGESPTYTFDITTNLAAGLPIFVWMDFLLRYDKIKPAKKFLNS